MRYPKLCVSVVSSFMLLVPSLLCGATVSFTNHSQGCNGYCGGAPSLYYHADLNNDGREDIVFAYYPEQWEISTTTILRTWRLFRAAN